jgi:enoyl-CoA hydratase
MAYETLLTEIDGNVGIVTLNRPQALNAFSRQLMDELTDALKKM